MYAYIGLSRYTTYGDHDQSNMRESRVYHCSDGLCEECHVDRPLRISNIPEWSDLVEQSHEITDEVLYGNVLRIPWLFHKSLGYRDILLLIDKNEHMSLQKFIQLYLSKTRADGTPSRCYGTSVYGYISRSCELHAPPTESLEQLWRRRHLLQQQQTSNGYDPVSEIRRAADAQDPDGKPHNQRDEGEDALTSSPSTPPLPPSTTEQNLSLSLPLPPPLPPWIARPGKFSQRTQRCECPGSAKGEHKLTCDLRAK